MVKLKWVARKVESTFPFVAALMLALLFLTVEVVHNRDSAAKFPYAGTQNR